MMAETDILVGTITAWKPGEGTRPSKFLLDVEGETMELTIWNDASQATLREELESMDAEGLVGATCTAVVRIPFKTYPPDDPNGVKQYKLSKIKVSGAAAKPKPKPEVKAEATAPAPPNAVVLKPLDPNSKDILIVDQVIFKGAMELRSGGAAVEQAVADAIAVWDGVRARHFVTQEAEIEEDIV